MSNLKTSLLTVLIATLASSLAFAAKVGDPAPAFSAPTAQGKTVDLAGLKGKYVVLEWHNQDCPYVKAQYKSQHMQKTQKEWTDKGVTWITVISSAPGKQGFVDAKGALADLKSTGATPTYTLLDPDGKIGHAYDAKTTPHMFVINPSGKLIYDGAIDDNATNEAADVGGKINYVSMALNEAMANKSVTHPTTHPYGCGVKYQ